MTKCNNCDLPADYVFSPRGSIASYYCKACVPWSLKEKLHSGQLDKVTETSAPIVEENPTVEENTEAVAEPEAVAEEVVEEIVELPEAQEEEAPKPAPRKKKAVYQPDSES